MKDVTTEFLHILLNNLISRDNWYLDFSDLEDYTIELWQESPYIELRVSYKLGLVAVMVYEDQVDPKHYPIILPFPSSSRDIEFLLNNLSFLSTHAGRQRANEGYSLMNYREAWRKR